MQPKNTAASVPAPGERVSLARLRTIAQLAAESDGVFTEGSLRWHVFHAKWTGLDRAIVRLGRRVYFDLDRFEAWLAEQRAA